jgi:hypothetical protein
MVMEIFGLTHNRRKFVYTSKHWRSYVGADPGHGPPRISAKSFYTYVLLAQSGRIGRAKPGSQRFRNDPADELLFLAKKAHTRDIVIESPTRE